MVFEEASTVFRDPLAFIFDDDDHSDEEHREIIVGHSTNGRLMIVCFTERAAGVIRIISARPATKKERENYEKMSVSKEKPGVKGDMRPEYNFDYGKAKPNRFAGKLDESPVVVVLDPDVSRIFQTPDAVNKALRALIEAMPPTRTRRKKASA